MEISEDTAKKSEISIPFEYNGVYTIVFTGYEYTQEMFIECIHYCDEPIL